MLYKLEQHGKATQFYWQHGAGPLRQLGNYGEAAEMAYAVIDRFSGKNPAPIPDLPEQLAEAAPCYTLPEAVSAAFRPWLDTSERRLSDSIRSAARNGRIKGAYKTPEGYWRLPVAAFNAWIASYSEQKRGRPRREAAAEREKAKYGAWMISIPTIFPGEYIRFYINKTEIDQLDTYTVELWRNRASGELYAVKRDSTGIAVGAFGPLDTAGEGVEIGDVDWSLDLAHTLQIDRILGGYERWEAGE